MQSLHDLPKGESVLSNCVFISAVSRPGTYQLSASDNTTLPQSSLTFRYFTGSAGVTLSSRRCSGVGGLSMPVTRSATILAGEARR